MVKQITIGQVKKMALEISKRWGFVNHGTYYNCIDTKTGQQSTMGGDRNLASYHFECEVERLYLELIGENNLYFNWQSVGVNVSEARKNYVWKIKDEIVRHLCGFKLTPTIVLPS